MNIKSKRWTLCRPILAFTSLALALGNGLLPAQAAPVAGDAGVPKIEFDSITYNFGKTNSGALVKHSFVFTNTGTATLDILDVHPGCGCTTAGAWDKHVEPGKTGVIPLQFNSMGFGGSVAKSASITCNDPAHTNLTLQITGTVWKPIDVSPAMAMFTFSDESQTNETRIVRIVSNLEEPLVLSDLVSTNKYFQAELKTVIPGKEFALHVTAVPPFTAHTTMAPIHLKTSSSNTPTIDVTAYAILQPALAASPEQLWLPAGPTPNTLKSSLIFRNSGTNLVKISEPRANVPGVEMQLQETQPGRMFTLLVTFPAGFVVEPGQKVEIAVNSDHPKYPVIKVPVIQQSPIRSIARPLIPPSPASPASPASPDPSTLGPTPKRAVPAVNPPK